MARRKKKKAGVRVRSTKEARLNILLDPDLKDWIRHYANMKHTSITAIVVRHFVNLQEQEEAGDVKQI